MMPTLRLFLVVTVTLALLGVGGMVAAQSDDERGGAFTIRIVDVSDVGEIVEASDPRPSGNRAHEIAFGSARGSLTGLASRCSSTLGAVPA